MNLKGSKTETNLQTAFMQECQARSRYTLFSETARREGYEIFTIPSGVGGRYSVLTAVGLLPVAVGGFDR